MIIDLNPQINETVNWNGSNKEAACRHTARFPSALAPARNKLQFQQKLVGLSPASSSVAPSLTAMASTAAAIVLVDR